MATVPKLNWLMAQQLEVLTELKDLQERVAGATHTAELVALAGHLANAATRYENFTELITTVECALGQQRNGIEETGG